MVKRVDDTAAFIIGGGPCLIGFDFSKLSDKHTIAVNKSFLHVPNLERFITVDHSFLRKIDRENLFNTPCTKIFVADFSYKYLQEIDGRITDTRTNTVYNLLGFDQIVKSKRKDGMGLTFEDFRTGKNSGFCALQLAVVLKFKRIFLLGLPLQTDSNTHFHGGYREKKESFNKKLDEYFEYFKKGLTELKEKSNIEVFSCSPNGRLNDLIPYRDVGEVL